MNQLEYDICRAVPGSVFSRVVYSPYFTLGLLVFVVIVSAWVTLMIHLRTIRPYRQDALSGVKYMMPYLIGEKKYFPVTGQYMIWIVNKTDIHFETDKLTFDKCNTGETVFIATAIKSKYIFCEDITSGPSAFQWHIIERY